MVQLREELIEKGKKRATTFFLKSWEEVIRDAVKELENLIENRKNKV